MATTSLSALRDTPNTSEGEAAPLDMSGDVSTAAPLPSESDVIAYADTLLEALRDVRSERAANREALTKRVQEITDRYEVLDLAKERREASLMTELRRVAELIPTRGKAKGREFANGYLGFKSHGPKLEITDKAALTEWAKADVERWVSVTRSKLEETIDKAKLDSFAATSKTVPPGCTLHPAGNDFVVRVA